MKGFLKIVLVFSFFLPAGIASGQPAIDKASFFRAISSDNTSLMDAQLSALETLSGDDKEAFEGALLMRKSGTLNVPAKKLAMFRRGYKKLETAIGKNPGNAEYRFLRLMVQENAPRSLGYYKNISQDSKLIKENYRALSGITRQSVASYSKQSKALSGNF